MSENEKYVCIGCVDEIERLQAENERLRELVDAGKEDRKAIDELFDENLRLRELLSEILPCLSIDQCYSELRDKIKKEMGDE